MIPIQDVVPTSRRPFVTVALGMLNVLMFLSGVAASGDAATAIAIGLFSHSSGSHLVFNMLFLWLFGDNVEDRLGRGALVLSYVLCGTVGIAVQSFLARGVETPLIGASAAIAGVIGAYFVLLPRSKVLLLVPMPISLVEVPAVFFLATFSMLQFLNFVVLPAASRVAPSPTAALAGLGAAFACGALVSAVRRRPIVW